MLKDVHGVVNRLEDKMDKRINDAEDRLDTVEGKTDNLLGKIGIGVLVISSAISLIVVTATNWVKSKFS